LRPRTLRPPKPLKLLNVYRERGSQKSGVGKATRLPNAKLSDDGKFFIVNGEKKWITNVSVGCRGRAIVLLTGSSRRPGSLRNVLHRGRTNRRIRRKRNLLERGPGLTTRHVFTQTSVLAGTSYVMLEDLKVPVGNLLGPLNGGFRTLMGNFNHERLAGAYMVIRYCRNVYADALHYAHKQKTFGKLLIDHPVIRDKVGLSFFHRPWPLAHR